MMGFRLFFCFCFVSCYQRFFQNAPIHLNPNMDEQPKFRAQSESDFFPDGRSSRAPVEGTIAKDELLLGEGFSTGMVRGTYLEELPIDISLSNLRKGQILFNATCASCHSHTGYGNGLVFEYGMYPPLNLHLEAAVRFPVGHIYRAISEGVRGRMPSQAYQLPHPEERWQVVAYVRALQMSQRYTKTEIPSEVFMEKGW